MGDKILGEAAAIAAGIVGLATLAVLVSSKAKTSDVITAVGKALSTDLSAAVSPVTGGTTGFSL